MRRPMSVLACAVVAAAVCAVSTSCRKEVQEPAVATPSLTLNHDKVPIGSPVKLTYRFVVASDAKLPAGDYWVFVHVLDPTGEQLWTDDHVPTPPISDWKPGQIVEYTRTVFVPNFPYIGEAVVRLGLYDRSSGNRLTLNAPPAPRKEYRVGAFQLLPQSENIFLIYKDGWHPTEMAADNATSEWQWTKKTATISLKNPRKDVTLYLESDARVDLFTPPQQVTIRIGAAVIAAFAAESRARNLQTFPIAAAQLGTGDMTEIVLDVDRTFAPGGGDTRDLGIRVFHAFVEAR